MSILEDVPYRECHLLKRGPLYIYVCYVHVWYYPRTCIPEMIRIYFVVIGEEGDLWGQAGKASDSPGGGAAPQRQPQPLENLQDQL